MSLIKQTMTEKNREAHRANGRKSHGPATPEGKERSRAAHLRHGLYSQGREEALTALGEDPAALAALIESTHDELQPTSDFQARISERMARLWWRMERAERIQESLMARQVQRHQKRRHDVALKLRFEGIPQIELMESLTRDPADPRFYTPRGYFHMFSRAFGDEVKGDKKEILLLMHQLRKPPGRWPRAHGQMDPAVPPPPAASLSKPAADTYLEDLEEMDEGFPEPPAVVTAAKGSERAELREDLIYLAKNELEIAHQVWDHQIEEQERTLPRPELDEVQAELHRHADLMRREEQSCYRQFMRLGNFLLKLQKGADKHAENEGRHGYVDESTENENPGGAAESPGIEVPTSEFEVQTAKSDVRSPRSEAQTAESEVQESVSGVQSPESEVQSPGAEVKSPSIGVENGESEAKSLVIEAKSEAPPKFDQAAA